MTSRTLTPPSSPAAATRQEDRLREKYVLTYALLDWWQYWYSGKRFRFLEHRLREAYAKCPELPLLEDV